MNVFNFKLIILGSLIAFFLFFCNLLFLFLCFLFRIRVLKFSMFLSPGFSLYDKKIGQTNFTLGWIPISSFVDIFGKTSDIEEQRNISEQDLPFAFFTKRLYKKIIILFAPSIVYSSIGILCSFLILKAQNDLWSLDYVFRYFEEAFKAMFGNKNDVLQFKMLSNKYALENNIIVFTYFLFSCTLLFCSLFDNLMNCLRLGLPDSKIKNVITILLMFLPVIFVMWKIPALIFEYYTAIEILRYLIDFFLGMLLFGSILFLINIFGLKLFKPKFLSAIFVVSLLFSCGKQEDVLLPKSSLTIVKNVEDLSPIYIFFKKEGEDTIAEVNRKNSIISTNWIFNVDKRLPLKVVIPEIIKLQEKKREEKAHKNEKAENYYSYADSVGKNLAFLPFTKVYYKMEKPKAGNFVVHFKKGKRKVFIGKKEILISQILPYFFSLRFESVPDLVFLFDKEMSYEDYIQYKTLLQKYVTYNLDKLPVEFIY